MKRLLCGLVLCAASCGESDTPGASATGGTGGGSDAGSGGSGGTAGSTPAPSVTKQFTPSDAELLDPERGFYDSVELVGGGDFDHVRQNGRTLAYDGVRLDAYRDAPLDAALLDDLDQGFEKARQAGIKLVLRFVYNEGPYPNPEPDAPLDRVLEHLEQLAPVLADNQDVIAVMQAGLIGAWGEWHSSTNGLDTPPNQETILLALLDALPPTRMTQIRTPNAKADIFGPAAIAEASAFDGSKQSRTGHHNDCFLATESDYGTYPDPIETWKDYVAGDGRFTPIGGETCAVNPPRSECAEATQELARLHFSFLNALYDTDVLDGWQAGGCLDEVKRRLGYRFSLSEVSYSERVRPGGVLALEVKLENSGYASLFNERPVLAVLDDGVTRRSVLISSADPRRWEGAVTIATKLRLPADLAPGDYELALWLPDAAESLRERPEYAVRFANDGVFSETRGHNVLATVTIDPDAPGESDPNATELAELP